MAIMNSFFGIDLKTTAIMNGVAGVITIIIMAIITFTVKESNRYFLTDQVSESSTKIIFSIQILIALLTFAFLVVGAVKKYKMFLIPWLIFDAAIIISQGVATVYSITQHFKHKEILYGSMILVAFVAGLALKIYLWLALVSLFQVFSEKKNGND